MATSTIDSSLPPLTAVYPPSKPDISRESSQTCALISHLNMQPHIEGGYFVETDRDALRVPNPFIGKQSEREEERKKEQEREREREATQERERNNTRKRERNNTRRRERRRNTTSPTSDRHPTNTISKKRRQLN
jgi:hypothetical protein